MERRTGYDMAQDSRGDYLDRDAVEVLLRAIHDEAKRAIADSGAEYEAADRLAQLRGGLERIIGMVAPEL